METHNFNLVSVVGKVVQLWDLSEVASLGHESQPANKDIAVCAINTQGHTMAYASSNLTLRATTPWGKEIQDFVDITINNCSGVAFSRCNNYLLTGLKDGNVERFCLERVEATKTFSPGHQSGTAVTSLCQSKLETNKVASVCKGGSLLIHHFNSGRKLDLMIDPRNQSLSSVLFSPHNRQEIVTGGDLGIVRLWTLPAKVDYFWQVRSGSPITSVLFDPKDQNRIFATSVDKNMSVIDKRANRIQQTIYLGRPLHSLAMHEEKLQMAVGDGGGGIHIYDLRNTTPQLQFQAIHMDGKPASKPIKHLFWRDIILSTRVVSEERVCSPRLHPFREIGYESYTEDEGHEGDLDVEEKKKIARKKSTLAMEEGKKEIEKKQETASPRSPLQVESGPSVTKSTEESNETLDPSRRRRRGPGPTRLAVFSVPRKPPQDLEEERSQEPPESTGKKRQLELRGNLFSGNGLHERYFSRTKKRLEREAAEAAKASEASSKEKLDFDRNSASSLPKAESSNTNRLSRGGTSSTNSVRKKLLAKKLAKNSQPSSNELFDKLKAVRSRLEAQLEADSLKKSPTTLPSLVPTKKKLVSQAVFLAVLQMALKQLNLGEEKSTSAIAEAITPVSLSTSQATREFESASVSKPSPSGAGKPSSDDNSRDMAASVNKPQKSSISEKTGENNVEPITPRHTNNPFTIHKSDSIFRVQKDFTFGTVQNDFGQIQSYVKDVKQEVSNLKEHVRSNEMSSNFRFDKIENLLEKLSISMESSAKFVENKFTSLEKNQLALDFNLKYISGQLKAMTIGCRRSG